MTICVLTAEELTRRMEAYRAEAGGWEAKVKAFEANEKNYKNRIAELEEVVDSLAADDNQRERDRLAQLTERALGLFSLSMKEKVTAKAETIQLDRHWTKVPLTQLLELLVGAFTRQTPEHDQLVDLGVLSAMISYRLHVLGEKWDVELHLPVLHRLDTSLPHEPCADNRIYRIILKFLAENFGDDFVQYGQSVGDCAIKLLQELKERREREGRS